jgi:predicted unusual protein kinase regulating ubiquinone biosynthesis (AarF/ABC1/UbiB family)
LYKETDYLQEAANLEFFRRALKPLSFVHVPTVIRSLTTDKVLTMSLLQGRPLGEWITSPSTEAARCRLGSRLLELFLFQVHQIRAIHADPHPGNYLIDPKGNIGLVDFGCVKKYTSDFSELTRCFLKRAWLKGETQFQRMMQLTWARPVDSSNADARRILSQAIRFAELVYPDPKNQNPVVDFGNEAILNALAKLLSDSVRVKLTNPEFIFHTRAELGLYNLLHRLGAKVDTAAVNRRLGIKDFDGDGR